MSTSAHQLFLLADHLKLSLLERQRAISLNIESTKQDSHIQRSLSQFEDGIEQLEAQQHFHSLRAEHRPLGEEGGQRHYRGVLSDRECTN